MEEQPIEEASISQSYKPEELAEYHRLSKKIEDAASGRTTPDTPIDEAGYYYGDNHPEYINEEILLICL